MAITRYSSRRIITTSDQSYVRSDLFKSRGVQIIQHFSTPVLKYPTPEELKNIVEEKRYWGIGTKYFNLSFEFYGSPEYWWIIAWYNLRPLETDFKPGDVVIIPTPLEAVLSGFGII